MKIVDRWEFVKHPDKVGYGSQIYPLDLKVIDLLSKEGPLTTMEIANKLNTSRKSIHTELLRLHKKSGCIKPIYIVKEGIKNAEIERLIENNPCIKRWLDKLGSNETKKTFVWHFYRYVRWLKSRGFNSPEELLRDRKKALSDEERYKHVDLAEEYIKTEMKGVSLKSKDLAYATIRSFYKYNRAELPRYKINYNLSKEPYRPPLPPIRPDEIRELIINSRCSIRDRAIILTLLQSGMDESTFCNEFNYKGYKQIASQLGSDYRTWDLSKTPVRLDLRRPKNGVLYFTFISKDAISSIQQWLSLREQITGRPIGNNEPLFITNKLRPLRPYNIQIMMKNLGFRSGLQSKAEKRYEGLGGFKYKYRAHELRDTFKTLCSACGINDAVSEFFLGHEIDELGYNKINQLYPEKLKTEYMKVEPSLNIFSGLISREELESRLAFAFNEISKLKSELEKKEDIEKRILKIEETQQWIMEHVKD